MGKIKIIILGVIMVVIGGCQGRFPEISSEGKIEGYIRDIMTNEPVYGASVQVADIVFATDGDGYFPLYRDTKNEDEMFLIPNSSGNAYSIKKTGYYDKKGITMLKYGQKNLLGYICPKPSESKYVVSGVVLGKTRGALEDVTVVINTPFDSAGYRYTVKTNNSGGFSIIDVPAGKINIYIYKDGYEAFSKIINLDGNWMDDRITINENSGMRYGDVSGNVSDEKGNFCDLAKVSIGHENSIYYQYTIADRYGNFILKGVPSGESQIAVKAPGFYKEAISSLTVTAGAVTVKNIKMDYLDYAEE